MAATSHHAVKAESNMGDLIRAAPPGPAQGWRSRDRWWLVAVEELVDHTVRPDIEVLGGVVLERRPVRAAATDVEGESAVYGVAVLVEAAPDGELAGVAGQARVLQRHGHKRAGLGEGGMDAAVVEGGGVLDQVAGGGDGVERPAPFAAGNDIHEGLDQVLLDGRLGDRRLGEGRRPDQQQAGGHQTNQQATNHEIPPRCLGVRAGPFRHIPPRPSATSANLPSRPVAGWASGTGWRSESCVSGALRFLSLRWRPTPTQSPTMWSAVNPGRFRSWL